MLKYITLENKNSFKSDYLNSEVINLLDNTFIIPKDFQFNILDVSYEYIARPDLISLDAYGDTMYADVICKINGISNPFELNEGVKLILPSPDIITNFVVKQSQSTTNEDDVNFYQANVPTSKKKTEKRKANEAIINDSRFKIDSTNGVIIY